MNFKVLEKYPDKELEAKWHAFIEQASFACGYTSPTYFKEPFWEGKNPFAILAFDETEQIIGVATGLDFEGKIVCGLEVRPQISIKRGANQRQVAETLSKGLLEKSGETGALIQINAWEKIEGFEDLGFQMKESEGSAQIVLLDLKPGADEVFKGFSQSRRSDIRKAMRQKKIEVSPLETETELKELYEIHKDWCRRKETEPDTWEMMKSCLTLTESQRIFIAKSEGRVIAGSYFRMARKGVVEYAANNSKPEYLKFRPNDVIVWSAIEWACKNGYTKFSMGGSHLFLRRFGGEVVSTYRYQLDRTFLKQHEKKEAVKNFVIKKYQALPDSTRKKIKQIVGKD